MWAALALAPGAWAAPEDALDAATRPFFLKAVAEETAGRPAEAAALYRLVLTGDPGFLPATLGLGRALEAAGDTAGAEALYRGLGDEDDRCTPTQIECADERTRPHHRGAFAPLRGRCCCTFQRVAHCTYRPPAHCGLQRLRLHGVR